MINSNRILIVDDEPDIISVFKIILEENGFRVDSFNDPLTALSNFRPGSYDLVILDIKMPQMDGFKLYQEMKKQDIEIKACFLTASEMYYEKFRKQDYCELDKTLFIRKPIENEELVKEINKIMRSC
jgi:DNA-binding response OmpR family regulator